MIKEYTIDFDAKVAFIDGKECRITKGFKENTIAVEMKNLELGEHYKKWLTLPADKEEGEFDLNTLKYKQSYIDRLNNTLTLENFTNFLDNEEEIKAFNNLLDKANAKIAESTKQAKEANELERLRKRLAELEATAVERQANLDNLDKVVSQAK